MHFLTLITININVIAQSYTISSKQSGHVPKGLALCPSGVFNVNFSENYKDAFSQDRRCFPPYMSYQNVFNMNISLSNKKAVLTNIAIFQISPSSMAFVSAIRHNMFDVNLLVNNKDAVSDDHCNMPNICGQYGCVSVIRTLYQLP